MGSVYTTRFKRWKASKWPAPPVGSRMLIIGNGMVGTKLCEYLVESNLNVHYEITVVGSEPTPGYDRIHLSDLVDHREAKRLILKSTDWYEANAISLISGVRVEAIDREKNVVRLSSGESLAYDVMVLATGSRPFVPPIEGRTLPNVFLYRTIEDLEAIIAAAKGKKTAAVVGGGLLGLEGAQAIQKLGLKATVVERAKFLMPQQLNEPASALLYETISEQNIDVLLARSLMAISHQRNGLELEFEGGDTLKADLVLISAGIIPNSELAAEAALRVGPRGGVIVDEQLQTDDRRIFAVGECALFGGKIYGLAAPGYAMAKHVATRLSGEKTPAFEKPDVSTRLKMIGTNVVTIGDALQEGRRIEFQTDSVYRMLLIGRKNQLIGGLGIGDWEEAARIQTLFRQGASIRDAEQEYFAAEGVLSDFSGVTPAAQLPDDRIICNCMTVTKGTLMSCLDKCGRDPAELAKATGASTVCGSCEPLINELCGTPPSAKKPVGAGILLSLSAVALFAVLATIFSPNMQMADSVESWWYQVDQFWRDNVIKQITGYTVAGMFVVGLLLSLRKRFGWFRVGHFARWRVFHAAFGLSSLAALFFHTGFRFGHNLNFWLMFTFVGLNLLGAFAGIVSAIESTGTSGVALRARRLRPALTYAHVVLFWPLPVLLIFHILSVYLY